jgi:hypothetical protein
MWQRYLTDSQPGKRTFCVIAFLTMATLLKPSGTARSDPISVTNGPILDIHVAPGDQSKTCSGFDTVNNRSLVVWLEGYPTGLPASDRTICGQLVNSDGTLYGDPISIAEPGAWTQARPGNIVAFSPTDQRFLVTWTDAGHVYSQLVNSDGSLYGANFLTSPSGQSAYAPVVAVDTTNNRFLLVWVGSDFNVYGQFVNPDGSLNGTTIAIASDPAPHDGRFPAVVFDAHSERFCVTWGDAGNVKGQMLNADGTLHGEQMDIGSWSGSYVASMAISTVDGTILDMWQQSGRLIKPDGTFVGDPFDIFPYSEQVDWASIIFDSANDKFLVAAAVYGAGEIGIAGQYVNPDGTLYGDRFQIFQIDEVLDREDHWHVGSYPPWAMFCSPDIGMLVTWEDIPYYSVSGHDVFGRYVELKPVPLPAAVTMGVLGLAVAGRFCRRRTLLRPPKNGVRA